LFGERSCRTKNFLDYALDHHFREHQVQLAGLHLREIKDIVDEIKEMPTGTQNPAQWVERFLRSKALRVVPQQKLDDAMTTASLHRAPGPNSLPSKLSAAG